MKVMREREREKQKGAQLNAVRICGASTFCAHGSESVAAQLREPKSEPPRPQPQTASLKVVWLRLSETERHGGGKLGCGGKGRGGKCTTGKRQRKTAAKGELVMGRAGKSRARAGPG